MEGQYKLFTELVRSTRVEQLSVVHKVLHCQQTIFQRESQRRWLAVQKICLQLLRTLEHGNKSMYQYTNVTSIPLYQCTSIPLYQYTNVTIVPT